MLEPILELAREAELKWLPIYNYRSRAERTGHGPSPSLWVAEVYGRASAGIAIGAAIAAALSRSCPEKRKNHQRLASND
jgi:hypothetical protein